MDEFLKRTTGIWWNNFCLKNAPPILNHVYQREAFLATFFDSLRIFFQIFFEKKFGQFLSKMLHAGKRGSKLVNCDLCKIKNASRW